MLREDGMLLAQLVPWTRKAWHATNANRYTLGLELAEFTAKPTIVGLVIAAAGVCSAVAAQPRGGVAVSGRFARSTSDASLSALPTPQRK